MSPLRDTALAAAILALACVQASAQTTPPTPAPKTDLDSKPGALSDKLSDTNGVIRPTGDVDPNMHRSAPQAGTMPVIKPGTVTPETPK